MLVLDKLLPFELKNNNDGRGFHWRRTKREKDNLLIELKLLGFQRVPFDHPVSVLVTRVLGPRQSFWDGSSVLRGNYKELEDALVNCGWWKDDSHKHITSCFGIQDGDHRKHGPAIRIQCFTEFYPRCPTQNHSSAATPTESSFVFDITKSSRTSK